MRNRGPTRLASRLIDYRTPQLLAQDAQAAGVTSVRCLLVVLGHFIPNINYIFIDYKPVTITPTVTVIDTTPDREIYSHVQSGS